MCQNDDFIDGENSGDEKIAYVQNFDWHPLFCCILSQYLCVCQKITLLPQKNTRFYIRNRTSILNQRFTSWYIPNPEQAGFRPGQGCLLQIFLLMILIDYSKEQRKNLYVGFMDCEKAFDYVNREGIITDLMKKGCGKQFTNAIAKTFTESTYYPKINKTQIGEGITTYLGVIPGRSSSANLFSFCVSDMPSAFNNLIISDYMDPYNLAQLVDDTIIIAEHTDHSKEKFIALLTYPKRKYQVPNIKKTKYCHFSGTLMRAPLIINNQSIDSRDEKKDIDIWE